MKNIAKLIDNLFYVMAVINIASILLLPSNNTDVFIWNLNFFYTFGSIILLLSRIVIDFSINRLGGLVFRKTSVDLLFVLSGLFFLRYSFKFFQFYILMRQMILLVRYSTENRFRSKNLKTIFKYPTLWIILSFFFAIIFGSFALMLPGMAGDGKTVNYIDALFTSTSAICVTGLTVIDTASSYSIFGQMIILFLIQIGGLGIMTISSALALVLGQKFSLRSEALMQNVLGQNQVLNFSQLVKNIIVFTFTIEFIGFILLLIPFYQEFHNIEKTVYFAFFHAVSAFCNAGFALFSDNFIRFQSNFLLNITISFLIIFGGLGFAVIDDTRHLFRFKNKFNGLKLHSKIVIMTTMSLIIFGTLAFLILEYTNTMRHLNLFDRILTSFFQSVTTRTAGFNTIDFSAINKSTCLITILLMYIGASPGSTGGGIKTTTFAVVFLAVVSILKGSRDVTVYNRKIPDKTIINVLALIVVSIGLITLFLTLLMIVEPFSFEKIAFEAFSAFGTVGLSMGITPFLSGLGKLLIIFLMFIGRVGPLSFIYAFAESVLPLKFAVPQENIDIG